MVNISSLIVNTTLLSFSFAAFALGIQFITLSILMVLDFKRDGDLVIA